MRSRNGFVSRQGRALALLSALLPAGLGSPARAEEVFTCELKAARGVPSDDAAGATDLLCEQLKRASGARGAYDVSFSTLGRRVFATASRRGTAETVTVQLDAIEEMATAGARIAEALVHSRPFDTTQRVDNLLQDETRKPLTKKGSGVEFMLGVADMESIGYGARGAVVSLGLLYTAPRYSLPAELRFGWSDADYPDPELDLVSISIGGRGYLTKKDWSPFAGAGISVLRLEAHEGEYAPPGARGGYFGADRSGVAPYLELGIEALRLHDARVVFSVRADFPTGSLRSAEMPYWDQYGREQGRYPAETRYLVPVSVGLSVAF